MRWLLSILLAGALVPVHAEPTIERITLLNAQNPGVIWMTDPWTTEWILGVSDQPGLLGAGIVIGRARRGAGA